MSKEIETIKDSVMSQIQTNQIKMKPKIYFIIGSFFTFIGLVLSMTTSVFLVGLIRFSFRSHGLMGQYRLDNLFSKFPWWTAILAIVFLFAGIWIMHAYDFYHKTKPSYLIVGLILVVIVAGWFIDLVGINDSLSRRGPMRGMMRGYMRSHNIQINNTLNNQSL